LPDRGPRIMKKSLVLILLAGLVCAIIAVKSLHGHREARAPVTATSPAMAGTNSSKSLAEIIMLPETAATKPALVPEISGGTHTQAVAQVQKAPRQAKDPLTDPLARVAVSLVV